jgi:uncharacterized membrane protein YtjA (UPF0391 family)
MGKLTHWAVVFVLLAMLYAFLGFGEGAGAAAPFAKFMFWSAIAGLIVASAGSLMRRT